MYVCIHWSFVAPCCLSALDSDILILFFQVAKLGPNAIKRNRTKRFITK